MPEAGRAIIQDQVAVGGTALPWSDRLAFAELMLSWEMRSYRAAQEIAGPVIFDRGLPDVVGYLRLSGLPVPPHIERAANLFPEHFHCSGVALRGKATADGHVLHARVLDYMTEIGLQNNACVTVFMPEKRNAGVVLQQIGRAHV